MHVAELTRPQHPSPARETCGQKAYRVAQAMTGRTAPHEKLMLEQRFCTTNLERLLVARIVTEEHRKNLHGDPVAELAVALLMAEGAARTVMEQAKALNDPIFSGLVGSLRKQMDSDDGPEPRLM